MFTFDQLRSFVAVAQELHFGRAAELLNMTQPPLSRQIQSLERQLQAQLFDRNTRAVRLTVAGRAFLIEAQRILALSSTAAESARRAALGVSGIVHIGFTSIIGHAHLPILLREVGERLPTVELVLHEMVTSDQLIDLANGAIDLGLGRAALGDPELSYQELPPEHLMLALPPNSELADKKNLKLADLHHQPFIMYNPAGARYFYDHLTEIFRVYKVDPQYVQRITQAHTMLALVEAGVGAALVPTSSRTLASDAVHFAALPELADYQIKSRMVWRNDSSNPALHRLLEALAR